MNKDEDFEDEILKYALWAIYTGLFVIGVIRSLW